LAEFVLAGDSIESMLILRYEDVAAFEAKTYANPWPFQVHPRLELEFQVEFQDISI